MTTSAFLKLTDGRVSVDLLTEIAAEVQAVEEVLHAETKSDIRLVEDIGRHTLAAGGKRLRPAFVTLAAKAVGSEYEVDRARKLGACMEMIHMATLIHDDVIDHAATRRGRDTASALYGNTASILSGDVLLARAMVILAQDGDLEIIRTVSQMVVEMAEGEVRELEARGVFELTEKDHLEILRMKTASFIECCCVVGGMLAGAPASTVDALKAYGYHVGMAFQMIDDLLDYRGDHVKTGKPLAGDFREGQATLPLILLRPFLTGPERDFVARKFGGVATDDELAMIARWMNDRGAFDGAAARAQEHVDCALASLAELPSTDSRDLLQSVAEFVLQREA